MPIINISFFGKGEFLDPLFSGLLIVSIRGRRRYFAFLRYVALGDERSFLVVAVP